VSRKKTKKAARAARRQYGQTMKRRHYLTPTKHDCHCNRCGRSLRRSRRDHIVYRHTPLEILCPSCADHEGVGYRFSSRADREPKGGKS